MDEKEFKEISENYAKRPVAKVFPENVEKIENAICVDCGSKIDGFKNAINKKEYEISGICTDCQNKIWK